MTSRFFILLSIFHCTTRAALVDKQSKSLWVTSESVDDRFVELVEEARREATTSSTVDSSRRSLDITRFAFLASPTITSRGTRNQRRKNDAATVDAAADFVSRDDANKNGESWSKRRVSSSTLDEFVTKRRSNFRRHHHCRRRFRCFHLDRRNFNRNKKKIDKHGNRRKNKNKEETEENERLEREKSFQPHQRSHNGNLERQLLVGNRSLALFRQELAAAAAANIATTTAAISIDDILADTKSKRTQKSAKRLAPKTSSKYKIKFTNKNASKNSDEAIVAMTTSHVERKINKIKRNLTSDVGSRRNKSYDISDRSLNVDDYNSPKIEKTFANAKENWKNKIENVTDRAYERKEMKEESTIAAESEKSGNEKDLFDSSVLASIHVPLDDRVVIHESLIALLTRLFDTLKNSTTLGESSEILRDLEERKNSLSNNSDENENDLCQRWLESKEKLEETFLAPLVYLPACPCQYPSNILNEDKIWDERQNKYFRWRDVIDESVRLDVYKPEATNCVRSLLPEGSGHAAAQHCCYDLQKQLLTRGTGAGTPNFVGPEISSKLQERIDILPWRLCKGDFTRFNRARTPNNDNRCKTNPEDEDYQRQL